MADDMMLPYALPGSADTPDGVVRKPLPGCPFCGCNTLCVNTTVHYAVVCRHCLAQGPRADSLEAAVAAWPTRFAEPEYFIRAGMRQEIAWWPLETRS